MKNVLIVDAHPLFRDFIKDKLSSDKVNIITATEQRDAFTKMITSLPSLIIIDRKTAEMETDFLRKKIEDPNTASIPIIISGPLIDRSQISYLARYGVVKYFTKPIKFDVLFESIGQILRLPIYMDITPCVLDIHRNGNVIFIEIAQGLNREKLALMKFKLAEMVERSGIDIPKVIIMMTNLDLSFIDGLNLEYLIDNVLATPKLHPKNIKVLSLSPFVKELIDGHKAYSEIEVTNNLTRILTSLVDSSVTSSVSDLITDNILTQSASQEDDSSSIETRFYSDNGSAPDGSNMGAVFRVAIIDPYSKTAELSQKTYESVGATTDIFNSGILFLKNFEAGKYDLVLLDVLMPDNTGMEILKTIKMKGDGETAIIVYSASTQRDLVVQVLSMGAQAFLVKPQKPQVLLEKSMALLHRTI